MIPLLCAGNPGKVWPWWESRRGSSKRGGWSTSEPDRLSWSRLLPWRRQALNTRYHRDVVGEFGYRGKLTGCHSSSPALLRVPEQCDPTSLVLPFPTGPAGARRPQESGRRRGESAASLPFCTCVFWSLQPKLHPSGCPAPISLRPWLRVRSHRLCDSACCHRPFTPRRPQDRPAAIGLSS